jgi:hypothetical protein
MDLSERSRVSGTKRELAALQRGWTLQFSVVGRVVDGGVGAGGVVPSWDGWVYMCALCPMSFGREMSLHGHMKTHERAVSVEVPTPKMGRKTHQPKPKAALSGMPPLMLPKGWGATSKRSCRRSICAAVELPPAASDMADPSDLLGRDAHVGVDDHEMLQGTEHLISFSAAHEVDLINGHRDESVVAAPSPAQNAEVNASGAESQPTVPVLNVAAITCEKIATDVIVIEDDSDEDNGGEAALPLAESVTMVL